MFAFDSFKQTFVDIRDHPSTMLVPSALLTLPVLFAVFVGSLRGGILLNLSLTMASQIFAVVWLPVLVIRATHAFATGTDPGVTGLFEKSTNLRLFSYIGTIVLKWLLVLAAVFIALLPVVIVSAATLQARGLDPLALFDGPQSALILISFVLGMLLSLGLIVLINLRYGLAEQANVLEKVAPAASLRRSNVLLKGHRSDFLLMLLLWIGISIILGIVVGGPGQLIKFAAGEGPLTSTKALIVALSTFLTTAVSVPLITGATTNFYLSLLADEVRGSAQSQSYPSEQKQGSWEDPQTGDLAKSESGDQT